MEPLVNIRLKGGGGTHQVPLSEVNDYVSKLRQTYQPLIDRAKRIEAHFKARRGDDGYQVGGEVGIRDILAQASQWLSESAPSEEALKEFGQDITPIWGDLRALGRAKEMIETPIDPTQFIRNGEFDLQAYNKAHYDKGAELGLELTAGVPILGLGAAGFKFALKDGRLLNVLADEAGRTGMRNQLGMITWQGSPHKYDGVLDPTKIGTGEGAQAYGYGHYLAENPNVAGNYAKKLSIDEAALYDASDVALEYGQKIGLEGDALDDFANDAAYAFAAGDDVVGYEDVFRYMESEGIQKGAGSNLYKFDLDDNAIANMLDWDALNDTPAVRKLWDSYSLHDFRPIHGKTLHSLLHEQYGSKEAVADAMRKAGIPGIKYYDGSSRAAGEGTRNFVLFPGGESLAEPLERNGVPFKK